MSKFFLFISLCTLILLNSCKTKQQLHSLVYFNQNTGDSSLASIVKDYEPPIQPGDRLSILVNALNPASAAPYNLTPGTASGTNSGYLVEADGTIQLPQLGKLNVGGMHRKRLVDTLTRLLTKYVTDPLVTINILNFKVTVLGEVNHQGTFNIPDAKVTLLEAIGLAGDLPITARRDNITVIREKNGHREFGKVNLLSKTAFTSPYFVLQQNDVVYVELTEAKVAASDQTLFRRISLTTSILSIITTVVVLIINVTN